MNQPEHLENQSASEPNPSEDNLEARSANAGLSEANPESTPVAPNPSEDAVVEYLFRHCQFPLDLGEAEKKSCVERLLNVCRDHPTGSVGVKELEKFHEERKLRDPYRAIVSGALRHIFTFAPASETAGLVLEHLGDNPAAPLVAFGAFAVASTLDRLGHGWIEDNRLGELTPPQEQPGSPAESLLENSILAYPLIYNLKHLIDPDHRIPSVVWGSLAGACAARNALETGEAVAPGRWIHPDPQKFAHDLESLKQPRTRAVFGYARDFAVALPDLVWSAPKRLDTKIIANIGVTAPAAYLLSESIGCRYSDPELSAKYGAGSDLGLALLAGRNSLDNMLKGTFNRWSRSRPSHLEDGVSVSSELGEGRERDVEESSHLLEGTGMGASPYGSGDTRLGR